MQWISKLGGQTNTHATILEALQLIINAAIPHQTRFSLLLQAMCRPYRSRRLASSALGKTQSLTSATVSRFCLLAMSTLDVNIDVGLSKFLLAVPAETVMFL